MKNSVSLKQLEKIELANLNRQSSHIILSIEKISLQHT